MNAGSAMRAGETDFNSRVPDYKSSTPLPLFGHSFMVFLLIY